MIVNKGKNMIEITTDTESIYMRDFADTQVSKTFNWGPDSLGNEGTTTFNVYQYAHNPMELYEANTNQPRLNLDNYVNDDYNEVSLFKGIPMMYRFNPVIREMMMTGNYRIRYRGCSKPQYGYVRSQRHCLAEYADTFAIYPK
tara:strand:- start:50 stop:478 length:429 start_codon:yes stop_codon:yes gene_type:complete